jgi:hypothetical protein
MAYSSAEGRQRLLDGLADATDEIGFALAYLGAAYEQLDEYSADTLEEELFGPVQRAYGRAKRTHADFAAGHDLPGATFEAQSPGLPSTGAKGFIENAVAAAGTADSALAALQDSPELLEVGDVELRARITEVRDLLRDVPRRARDLLRRLGR